MDQHDKGQVAASAAEIYDQFFVPALFAEWPDRVLKAAGVVAGDRVLDVACGTGILARRAFAVVVASGSAAGLDINEGMLAVAEQNAPQIEWKIGRAESLPFEDDSFDKVVSQFGLMFFEDKVAALKEMKRVVRPGGTVGVAVWGALEETPGYAAVAVLLQDLFGAEVANSIRAPYSLGDRETLKTLFGTAGMEDIEILTIMGSVNFASLEDWIFTDIKGWTLADVIDDEDYERMLEKAPEKLGEFVQADGSVRFDAPAHIVIYRK